MGLGSGWELAMRPQNPSEDKEVLLDQVRRISAEYWRLRDVRTGAAVFVLWAGGFRMSAVQPMLYEQAVWIPIRDADPTGLAIFERHYSFYVYRDGRKRRKFVGPGEYTMLITPDARALFVWRKFRSADDQQGINCAVFRNEGAGRSSDLIREADAIADARWPGERHFTYVNPRKIRSQNPGYCFLMAGWRRCGVTKARKLLILERVVCG